MDEGKGGEVDEGKEGEISLVPPSKLMHSYYSRYEK